MKCQRCGHENPEHVVYCGKCGEWAGEPIQSLQNSAERSTSVPAPNDSFPTIQSPVQRGSAGLPQYSIATIAAFIGVALLIASLVLYIYYYELQIDVFVDHTFPRDSDDMRLLTNIGKAMAYSQMAGYICVVLAILLLVHGSLARQRLGVGLTNPMHVPLSRIIYLVILALVSVTIAFGLRLFLSEVQPDLDVELMLRLSGLIGHLQNLAWVCLSLVLFLVARRMRQEMKKPNANQISFAH